MDLTGRYLKVLDDVAKTHYPCIKGDYMLFNKSHISSNGKSYYQYWGEMGKRSNYHGIDVHLNPDFKLMPEGFNPNAPDMKYIDENIKWIRSGKIGCTFATALAKNPEKIGWEFQVNPSKLEWGEDVYLLSIIFPDSDIHQVKQWALDNNMYIENIDGMYEGLS